LLRIALATQLLTSLLLAMLLAADVASAAPVKETLLSGETMGSAWTVKIAGPLPLPAEKMRAGIQERFEFVNLALSTYRKDSALSRFNDDDRGEWVDIDRELAFVMTAALDWAEKSGGAYDPTVGPLVNLWGFGPDPARNSVPDAKAVEAARKRVGWEKIEIDHARKRARKQPGVRIDLSSLGKGRGVDRVAEYLDSLKIENYLIDLSGKLRGHGRNARGAPWRVAVEQPLPDDPSGRPRMTSIVVELGEGSIATAGDYRRYFEIGGKHYSHIIDPRTGWPVTHATASVTVQGPTCMGADALATVYMAMLPDDAMKMADAIQFPALFIRREGPGFVTVKNLTWRLGEQSEASKSSL
jgi:thiamine biosynthesis lipoprotein